MRVEDVWIKYKEFLSRYREDDSIIRELNLAAYIVVQIAQLVEGVKGDVAEIGVYRGGSLSLMSVSLGGDEKAFAIDVFDKYGGLSPYNDPKRFLETVERISGGSICPRMITADTTIKEDRERIIEEVSHGVRLSHVDGDHRLLNVSGDLVLAMRMMDEIPGAIMIVDDTFQASEPEVTEGMLSFLKENESLRPFAIVDNKTYISSRKMASVYAKYMFHMLAMYMINDVRHVAKSPVLVFKNSHSDNDGIQVTALSHVQEIKNSTWEFPTLRENLQ